MDTMDNNNNVSAKKKTSRKISLDRKIEKKSNLQVTFTKRRKGLFQKAGELSILCGVDVAVLVLSPGGKIFSFGRPSADAVIRRFEGESSTSGQIVEQLEGSTEYDDEAFRNFEKRDQMWWNKPIESMALEELEQFVLKLEALQSQSAIFIEK